jgi:hypothetical protein
MLVVGCIMVRDGGWKGDGMAISTAPVDEQEEDVHVFEWTKAEYRRALKRSLDDMGITYRQLKAMARKDEFVSSRARCLWLVANHNGSGW